MPYDKEVRVFKQELDAAREQLRRWVALGRQLRRTRDPKWKAEFKLRQSSVKRMRILLKVAKNRP